MHRQGTRSQYAPCPAAILMMAIERCLNMNTSELQQLKMAWIAAKEAGDTNTQVILLRDHPEAQAALIEFIAAYAATGVTGAGPEETTLLPLTLRAGQTALGRVFDQQVAAADLQE